MRAIDAIRDAESLAIDNTTELVKGVDTAVKTTVNAGQTPDGVPWPPTDEGTEPLQNAAAAIRTIGRVSGRRVAIVVKITSRHHFLHHAGLANGAPRRQIIPDGPNDNVDAAISGVLGRAFRG